LNCKGDEDVDAKRSRPSIGKPASGHARKERVLLIGTDQRITSGPAATAAASLGGHPPSENRPDTWLHPNASRIGQIPLALRAPSIHDPKRALRAPGCVRTSAAKRGVRS